MSEEFVLVKALADFEGAEAGELSFKEGDILKFLEKDDSGWSKGILNGVKGWFPSDFVEVVPAEDVRGSKRRAPPPKPASPPQVAVEPAAKPAVAAAPAVVKPPVPERRSVERPVPAFSTQPLPRVGVEKTIVSPRGTKLKTLNKLEQADNEAEEGLLNFFIGKDPKKTDIYSEALSASSGNGKPYPSAVEVYEGYLDEMLKCLKLIHQREVAGLPAPTSTADPLNASNAQRLLDIFRNFLLAVGSQDSSFGLSEAVAAIVSLAKQLKVPSPAAHEKKAKKDAVPPSSTALEFLLSTLLRVLTAREGDPKSTNPIADLSGDVLSSVLQFCFNCLPGTIAPAARKMAGECLGALSAFHLQTTVDLFKERLSKCKSDDDFRAYAPIQTAIKYVKFSLEPSKVHVLQQYLVFLIQVESKFTASSLRIAVSESLIDALQELKAPETLHLVEDDQMRSQLGASLFKIYEFAMKKWIKKPKNRAAGFRLAMFMFLLFDPQRKDLNKKDITKIFLDQLKDSKQRLEGIESFSSFLRMLPSDFAKPSNPGHKVWKMIIGDAIPALFVKKTKDVSAVEWKELTGVLSAMLALDETLLAEPALVNILKSSDYSMDSRCVILRTFGGAVVSSSDAQLGQSLQPAVTPIISQFCSGDTVSSAHHLSSLLVCFPSLCIPESRRQIATSLIPGALSSDPEMWTCSLQALQRFLLDDPEPHLQFLMQEMFKYLKNKAASDEALVHVRGLSLLMSSFVNHRKQLSSTRPVALGQAKALCLCWMLHPDQQVRQESFSLLDLIGKVHENDLFDILVNGAGLRQRSGQRDLFHWTLDLCNGLLADKEFEPLIRDTWALLQWHEPYVAFFCRTLHVVTAGGSSDQTQVGFDIMSHALLTLSNEETSLNSRNLICSALQLVDESVIEPVARLALTVVGDAHKRKGGKTAPTLRGKAKGSMHGGSSLSTESLMLRGYVALLLQVSPAQFEKSSFLQSFLSDRLAFWSSNQVDVAVADVLVKEDLTQLIASSFLLSQSQTSGVPPGPSEHLMSMVVAMATTGSSDDSAVDFHRRIGLAVRDFFRFASFTPSRLVSEWAPFALKCVKLWPDLVSDSVAEGFASLLERHPEALHAFILDALPESNFLFFSALCITFERKVASWMTKYGAETLLSVCLVKMCSMSARARPLAVSLANVLGRENVSIGRELFYTDNLDLTMYVQQAVEYGAALAEKKPNLTPGLFEAFAQLYVGLSDQQKTISLILLEPWTKYFSSVTAADPKDGTRMLNALLQISVASDPVFHREHIQQLYMSLEVGSGQVALVVEFLLARYADDSDHCISCLASLMRTNAASDLTVALEGHLRTYPELGSAETVPTSNESRDHFALFDSKASAAFKMLQYISLEHSDLLYRFLPSLLHSAFVYYRSAGLVRNLCESLVRMEDIVPDAKQAVENLTGRMATVIEHFDQDRVEQEDVDLITTAFGPFCPDLKGAWSEIALQWALGNTVLSAANCSARVWGYLLEDELSVEQVDKIAFFCFSCMYNGWLSKLYRLLDVLGHVVVSVPMTNADAKAKLVGLLCDLTVSCAPVQVRAALHILRKVPDPKGLSAALKSAAGGSEAVFRGTLMRPFFLEATAEPGLHLLRSLLKGSESSDTFAAELTLVVGALLAQQTDALREDVYKWIVSDSAPKWAVSDFVALFGRASFHLKSYECRKFCFDFTQVLLGKFPKGNVVDILLVLLRNTQVESFKAPCFRLMDAVLELSPKALSKSQYKLLQELATFNIYNSSADVRLTAEQILLDLIMQYTPNTGVPAQLLTLVRVVPGNLSVQLVASEHLFPGDFEADFFNTLKRSELAISSQFFKGNAAAANLVRDQKPFKLTEDDLQAQRPVEVPEAIPVVEISTTEVTASSLKFLNALYPSSDGGGGGGGSGGGGGGGESALNFS